MMDTNSVISQQLCGFDDWLSETVANDPNMTSLKVDIDNKLSHGQYDENVVFRTPVIIPVIFHVVWSDPVENIGDDVIWSDNSDVYKL